MSEYTPETLRDLANSILRGEPFHEHFYAENMRGCADAWAALEKRLEALTLPKHQCEMVACAQWNDVGDRAHWVGRLLEPIPGYEQETHCMHFVTPLKGEVVFGFIDADFGQLAALCEAASGHPINPQWLGLKAQDFIGNVRYLRQQGVPEAAARAEEKDDGLSNGATHGS
jgi:hypothetical protein